MFESMSMLNLTNNELKLIAKRRSIDGFQNISKKQLKNVLNKTPLSILRPIKSTPTPISIKMDEFEKNEIAKKDILGMNGVIG